MILASLLGWLCLALAVAGSVYMAAAGVVAKRFFAGKLPETVSAEGITILKPLYGAEPKLAENLSTFLDQDYAGPIQLLCGIQRPDDPAITVVENLRRHFPAAHIDMVVDPTPRGANGKVANLINMTAAVAHPWVVLSDSDIAVERDYLSHLLAAFDDPRVGVVTCLYRGKGDAGFWSVLGAAGLSYHFLPNAAFASMTAQMGNACMGSTIALRRETLQAIGGFERFADILADDHAIGAAVRALGQKVAIPAILVAHGSDEDSFSALWRHELRWAATVRGLTPSPAYLGSLITYPLPLALLGTIAHPAIGLVVTMIALLSRLLVMRQVDRIAGTPTASAWLLPLRDMLSLMIFVASFVARSVDWRGAHLTIERDGRIAPATESLGR